MKFVTLLFAVLSFTAAGRSQTYDQCQQSCTNGYNFCTGDADQQLSQCLHEATTSPCFCDSLLYCPPPPEYCPTEELCNYLHDEAVASCNTDYGDCSSSCGGEVPPNRAFTRGLRKPVDEAAWALLMRDLSRPMKLKLTG